MKQKSYEKIDYRIRPAKFVERKMIKEACQKLNYFDGLSNYHYVGFGSVYYVDFKLFHKELGIQTMTSIEHEEDTVMQERFLMNRPYNFINILFEKSTCALNSIDYTKNNIIWLDYDSSIQKYMFEDVEKMVSKVKSGSIVMISLNKTINSELEKKHYIKEEKIIKYINRVKRQIPNGEEAIENSVKEMLENINSNIKTTQYEKRVEQFKENLEGSLTRINISEEDLTLKNSHKILQEMIDKKIRNTIKLRNSTLKESHKLVYKQLFNFLYKDGADMMTIGGIIYSQEDESKYEAANFEELEFIKQDVENYEIKIPKLTYREMINLDHPIQTGEELATTQAIYMKEEEVELYKKLYRYLPSFSNTEIL